MNDRIRTDIAHNARVWNHWLGGKDNYAVDRAAGDAMIQPRFSSTSDQAFTHWSGLVISIESETGGMW